MLYFSNFSSQMKYSFLTRGRQRKRKTGKRVRFRFLFRVKKKTKTQNLKSMRKRENAKTLFKILRKRENVFVVFVLEKRKTVSSKNAKTGKRFRGFRDKRLKIGAIFHENRENENGKTFSWFSPFKIMCS